MKQLLLLGALGLVLAIATGLAVHVLTRETIALPVVKLEQGDGLAPAGARAARTATTTTTVRRTTPRTSTAATTARASTPRSTSTAERALPTTLDDVETDHNSGSGSDNSGRGRGRGRGRGGDGPDD